MMKQKKQVALGTLLLSMVIGFFLTADTKLVFCGDLKALYKDNYVQPWVLSDLFIWLGFTAACFAVIVGCAALYRAYGPRLLLRGDSEKKLSGKTVFLSAFAVIFIAWIPYLLTYYPGGLYSDSFTSLYQVLNSVFSNRHPLLFTFGVGLFVLPGMKIGGSLAAGTMTYTVAQTIAMALVMAYFILWLHKHSVKKWYCVAATLFIAVFPLFPFYAIAMWKDTPFSLACLLYILFLIDVFLTDGKNLEGWLGAFKYALLTFFVVFYRNNGIYLCLLVHLVLTIAYRKRIQTTMQECQGLFLMFLIGYSILYGPIYKETNLATDPVESLGVTNQQIFAVFTDEDGRYSEEEAEFVSMLWDLDEIPEKYTPLLADITKWGMDRFDEDYLDAHLGEYLKTWFTLCLKNFRIYVDACLLETMSFWSPTKGSWEAYIQPGVWYNDYNMGPTDYFYQWTGFDFGELVEPDYYFAPGLFFWIAMAFTGMAWINAGPGRRTKSVLAMLPIFGLWVTLMIATPIAVSLRYAYPFVLVLPLLPVYTALATKKQKQ